MAHKIFKTLVPVYIVWFIAHMIFFFSFIISQISKQTQPNMGLLALLFISHFLVIFSGIVFWIFMIVDCATRKFKNDNDKVLWILLIVFLNVLGAVIYYYVHGIKPVK